MNHYTPSEGSTQLYTGPTTGGGRRRGKGMTRKDKKALIRHTKKVHTAYKQFVKLAKKLAKK